MPFGIVCDAKQVKALAALTDKAERAEARASAEAERANKLQGDMDSLQQQLETATQERDRNQKELQRLLEEKRKVESSLSGASRRCSLLETESDALRMEASALSYGGPPRFLVEIWQQPPAPAGGAAVGHPPPPGGPWFVGEQWMPAIDEIRDNLRNKHPPQFTFGLGGRLQTSRPDPGKPEFHASAQDAAFALVVEFQHRRGAPTPVGLALGHDEAAVAKELDENLADDVYAFQLREVVAVSGDDAHIAALTEGAYRVDIYRASAGDFELVRSFAPRAFFPPPPPPAADARAAPPPCPALRFGRGDEFTVSIPRVQPEVRSRLLDVLLRVKHEAAGQNLTVAEQQRRQLHFSSQVADLERQLHEANAERVAALREMQALRAATVTYSDATPTPAPTAPAAPTRGSLNGAAPGGASSASDIMAERHPRGLTPRARSSAWTPYHALLLAPGGVLYDDEVVSVYCTLGFENSDADGCKGYVELCLTAKRFGAAFEAVHLKCSNPDRSGLVVTPSPIEPDEPLLNCAAEEVYRVMRQKIEFELITVVDQPPRLEMELGIGDSGRTDAEAQRLDLQFRARAAG